MSRMNTLQGALSLGKIFDIAIVAGDIFLGRYFAKLIAPYVLPETFGEAVQPQPPAFGFWLSVIFLLVMALYVLGLSFLLEPLKKLSRKRATGGDYAAAAFNACLLGTLTSLVIIELVNWNGEGPLWPLLATVLGFFIAGGLWFALHIRALSHMGKVAADGDAGDPKKYTKRIVVCLLLVLPLIFFTLAPVNLLAEGMSFKYRDVAILKWTPIDVGLAVTMRSLLLALLAWWFVYLPRKIVGAPLGAQLQGWKFFSAFFVSQAVLMMIDVGWNGL